MTKEGRLDDAEVKRRLASLSGWDVRQGRLHKEFAFASFPDAFSFMTRVAFLAEKLDHHPDWSNSYDKVVVDLSSHDVGGISARDFRLATGIDGL